ncbi:MAG: protein translocase subunit SecF [Syntrophales bacterium]|nr:protein translocase subunit SecF [Syntrophales bacterium]
MELVKPGININFVRAMKWCVILSIILTIFSIAVLLIKGITYGIDFAGGTLIQIKVNREIPTDSIRNALTGLGISDAIIQPFGQNEFIVRTAETSSEFKGISEKLEESLSSLFGSGTIEIQRVEYVGPKVGKDLTRKAIFAVLLSWIGMLIYIALRFELRYAVGGIIGVIHDVIVVMGFFALLGREFSLPVVAALLTTIGYSIHDSIVVFDRIRENVRKESKKPLPIVMNDSINQTLSRTILTSLTTAMVVAVLYIFGGPVINDFAFVLLVGVIFGTYSSVFIASPVVLAWEKLKPSRLKLRKK